MVNGLMSCLQNQIWKKSLKNIVLFLHQIKEKEDFNMEGLSFTLQPLICNYFSTFVIQYRLMGDSGFCNRRDNCNERLEILRAHLWPSWGEGGVKCSLRKRELFASRNAGALKYRTCTN